MSIDPSLYRGVMTDTEITDLVARNDARRAEAIRALGPAWLGWARTKAGVPLNWPSANVSTLRKRKAAK